MGPLSIPTRSTRLPQRAELPARPQEAIGSCYATFPSITKGSHSLRDKTCRRWIAWVARSLPSTTAIRNDDDRDATSKPSGGVYAAVGVPTLGQEAPNREWVPSRAQELIPIAIRIGDDRDPTSKPNGACALAVDPSPGEAPNRGRPPSLEHAAVPTTALASRGSTLLRPVQDQERPASPLQPR